MDEELMSRQYNLDYVMKRKIPSLSPRDEHILQSKICYGTNTYAYIYH